VPFLFYCILFTLLSEYLLSRVYPGHDACVPLQKTVETGEHALVKMGDACPMEEFVDLFPPHPNHLPPRGEGSIKK